MLPFAQNASTRFISPTKTPEYLAAGKPVVSTPIPDVVKPYGEMKLVKIGVDVHGFSEAIHACLHDANSGWLARVDRFLACTSWDTTFAGMWRKIERCISTDSSYCTTAVGERGGVDV
jgi:UDP-galactopyranose mutase